MHVSFDLDGVLLDSESDLDWMDRALSATLRDLGCPDTEAARRSISPWRLGSFEESAAALGVDAESLWATRDRHYTREKVAAIESGELGPFPDVDVLPRIAAEHDLSVLSNSPQSVVEAFVETHLDGVRFVALVGRGSDYGALDRLKPDPHLYDRLREAAGLADAGPRVVYVGDTESDETFARRVGAAFVGVRREGGLDDLRALPEALAGLDGRRE